MTRNGSTTISKDLLAMMLIGPQGPVKLDALTAICEDRDAGDLPGNVRLGALEVTSIFATEDGIEVEWSASLRIEV